MKGTYMPDKCSHGKSWKEPCAECEIVSLKHSLSYMEPTVKRDRERLEQLLREQQGKVHE